jgi:hypothetical protein
MAKSVFDLLKEVDKKKKEANQNLLNLIGLGKKTATEKVKKTVKDVSNAPIPYVLPIDPLIADILNLSGVKKPKVTVGQAANLAADVTYRPITRLGFEAAQTVAKDKKTYTPQSALEKILFGDKPLQNFQDPQRPSRELARQVGVPEKDIDKFAVPAMAAGMALDLVPPTKIGAGLAKKAGKEVIEKAPVILDLLKNPTKFARLTGTPQAQEELNMIKKWEETIKNPRSIDKVQRFLSGETNLMLLPKEKQVVTEMQDWLTKFPKAPTEKRKIDDIGAFFDNLPASTKPGSRISNIPEVNNPLLVKAQGRKDMAQLMNYPKLLANRGYTSEQVKNISAPMAREIMEKSIPPTDTAALNALRTAHKENYTSVKDIINTGIDPQREAQKLAEQNAMKEHLKKVGAELEAKRPVINPAEEGKRFVDEMLEESRQARDPKGITPPVEKMVDDIYNDVKKKVNILDFFRTPNRILEKLGLGEESKLLRKQYDTYLQELPKEVDRVSEWAKRAPKENQAIFRWLDGNKGQTLSPEARKVAEEIKDYLKEWAAKLKLPEDKQVSDYITHLFPRGAVQQEFDPEIAKLIRGKIVKSVYDPFLKKRTNKPEYVEDTWQALTAYIKRGVRKYNMDPALEQIERKAVNLPEESFNYVKGRIARINMQPTEIDNWIDNAIKSSPIGYKLGQRPFTVVTQKSRQMVNRALLGLNVSSALRNMQQATNTYSILGEKYFGIGFMKTLQNLPRYLANKDTELEKAGVLGKDIVQDLNLNPTKKFWENADKGFFYLFSQVEKINRSAAYFGAKAKALKQGKSEEAAIDYAKQIVAKTQFQYDVIDTPAFLQNDLTKTAFQYARYPLGQGEFLAEMVKDKNIVGALRYVASNLLFIAAAGQVLGLKPQDMFPQFRFGTPPTLQLPQGLAEAALSAPDQYGNVPEGNILDRILANKNVQKGALNYVPGGAQGKKTFEGVTAYNEGASKTPTGRERFEVPQTPENRVKTAVFGQYATQEGREYIASLDSGAKTLSQSEKLHKELSSLSREEANKKVRQIRQENPALYRSLKEVIRDEKLGTTDEEKKIRNKGVSDGSRAEAIVEAFSKLKGKEEKSKLYAQWKEKGIITADVIPQLKEYRSQGKF